MKLSWSGENCREEVLDWVASGASGIQNHSKRGWRSRCLVVEREAEALALASLLALSRMRLGLRKRRKKEKDLDLGQKGGRIIPRVFRCAVAFVRPNGSSQQQMPALGVVSAAHRWESANWEGHICPQGLESDIQGLPFKYLPGWPE